MEAKWIGKIITVGTSSAVILPTGLLRQMNWKRKDAVVLTAIGPEQISVTLLGGYLTSLSRKGEPAEIIKL